MLHSFESVEIISNSPLVRCTVSSLFGQQETEIVRRTASYVVKLRNETGDKITRIILLPPTGFTANQVNETLPYAEARQAKITIRGAVRSDNQRFSRLKNCLKFCYYLVRDVDVIENYPSALIDKTNPNYREEIKSAQQTFFAVKENGEGFYHNLVNLTDDWLLLVAQKELAFLKKMEVEKYVKQLDSTKQKIILRVIAAVKQNGDALFTKDKSLVGSLLELRAGEAIPPLIEALNIYETGKHEPCTVYALILKFGRKNKQEVLHLLKSALTSNLAPKYYLEELVEKLS